MDIPKVELVGKRLAALDYGEARIGIAVCDELHIGVYTRPVIMNDEDTLENIRRAVEFDRVEIVFVGVPRLLDERTSEIIKKIEAFIQRLKEFISQPVYETDESFSTKRAKEQMVTIGKKQSKRREKGAKDAVAAAIILQDILDEIR